MKSCDSKQHALVPELNSAQILRTDDSDLLSKLSRLKRWKSIKYWRVKLRIALVFRLFYVPREALCKHRIKVACLSNWWNAKQSIQKQKSFRL